MVFQTIIQEKYWSDLSEGTLKTLRKSIQKERVDRGHLLGLELVAELPKTSLEGHKKLSKDLIELSQ